MKITRRGGGDTVRSYRLAARASGPKYFSWESFMAELAPPAITKSPVRAALCGRPGLTSQLFLISRM